MSAEVTTRKTLFEHTSRPLDLTRHQAEALHRTGFVEVTPAPDDRWCVKATSYVGSLVVDGSNC